MRTNSIIKFTAGLAAVVAPVIGAVALAADSPTLVCGLTGKESTTHAADFCKLIETS